MTKPDGVVKHGELLIQIEAFILRGGNALLAAIRDDGVPGLRLEFLSKGYSVRLRNNFLKTWLPWSTSRESLSRSAYDIFDY